MSESRTELLAWLNDLLKLNYNKVEQCGTGAAHCQILDTIYPGCVNLSKVKFNTKQEYEYIQNFKILQAGFQKKNIDKIIPIEKLIKCRFQDNLEFLQWMKRYWDSFYNGEEYDAEARRNSTCSPNGRKKASKENVMSEKKRNSISKNIKNTNKNQDKSNNEKYNSNKNQEISEEYEKMIEELKEQIDELKINTEGLEKERNFYFNKLREIEILVQTHMEDDKFVEKSILKEIQAILYNTEEGFEIPDGGGEDSVDENNDDEMF